ncbi:MAG: four helix bundle protein [Myxococcota bacterium]
MIVYRKSIELVRVVQCSVQPSLRSVDRELSQQLHRAARSVVLNIAEARSARGRNRGRQFAIALGSAREVHACLELAVALSLLPASLDVERLLDRSDHIQAMLWKLSR